MNTLKEKTKKFIMNYPIHFFEEKMSTMQIAALYGIANPYEYLDIIAENCGCTRLDLLRYPELSRYGISRASRPFPHTSARIRVLKTRIEMVEDQMIQLLKMIREIKGEKIMGIETLTRRKLKEYARDNKGIIHIKNDYCCTEEDVLHRIGQLYKYENPKNDLLAELQANDKAYTKSLQSKKKKQEKKEKKGKETTAIAKIGDDLEALCKERDRLLAEIETIGKEIEDNKNEKENFENQVLPSLEKKMSIIEESIEAQQRELLCIKQDTEDANNTIRKIEESITVKESEIQSLEEELKDVDTKIENMKEVFVLAYRDGSFETVDRSIELNTAGWEDIETELKNNDDVYLALTGQQTRTLAKSKAIIANSDSKIRIEFEDAAIAPFLL